MPKEVVKTIKGKEYVFRRWTWGQKNEALAKCIKPLNITGVANPADMTIDIDLARLNEETILATLKKAPFKVNLANIRALDPELGDALLAAARDVTGPTVEDKENLSEP